MKVFRKLPTYPGWRSKRCSLVLNIQIIVLLHFVQEEIYIFGILMITCPIKCIPERKGIIKSLHWGPTLPARLAVLSDKNTVEVLYFDGIQRTQQLDLYRANTLKPTTILNDLAGSNDSSYLAASSKSTHPYVCIWNVDNGDLLPRIQFPDSIISIAWLTDTKNHLAIGRESSDTHVQVWDILNGGNWHSSYRYRGGSIGIDRLVWSPGPLPSTMGKYIVAGAEGDGYVYAWNVLTSGSYELMISIARVPRSLKVFQIKTLISLPWPGHLMGQ